MLKKIDQISIDTRIYAMSSEKKYYIQPSRASIGNIKQVTNNKAYTRDDLEIALRKDESLASEN